MVLALDVGNTNITCGVFNEDEMVGTFRINTPQVILVSLTKMRW